MKKTISATILLLVLLVSGHNVYAAEALKIQQNGVVKRAKEIGSGNGIVFNLPELPGTNFATDGIEFAIFQKSPNDTNYKVFGSTKLVENPTSLNITFDFGDTSKYKTGTKYKIGYRYYTHSIDDSSICQIAGYETKEGWRLVGEPNPILPTTNGFSFYVNSPPTISLNGITVDGEDINGTRTFSYTPTQLANAYLPQNALESGITVNYTADSPDAENTLTVYYKLVNKQTGTVIADSVLGSDKKIRNITTATNVELVLYVVDNWGSRTDTAPVTLKIDRQTPTVSSQFQDMGKTIRGRELYSKFKLLDDSATPLSGGNVYYSVKRNGTVVVNTTRFNNSATGEYTVNLTNQDDGNYEIALTIFDKAYNKLIHTMNLTLDNTPPTLRFVPQAEDNRATLYNTWINYNSNVLVDIGDSSGIKKVDCTESGTNIYSSSGVGIKVIPIPSKTGKLTFNVTVEDTACTLDKANNKVNTSSQGNVSSFSNSVWIDKTLPTVTINADESNWYPPTTITASFSDNESSVGKGDNSGIKTKQYQIGDTITNNWLTYVNGAVFNTGGIFYLHVKAIDNAGNERVVSKKIKINIPITIGKVTPTNDYLHTIYNSFNDIYVIKNTAFNTKYQFDIQDYAVEDSIKAEIKLVSKDNIGNYSTATVYSLPTNSIMRNIVFNISYLKANGTTLPDGVYTMYLTVSQTKIDGDILTLNNNIKGCEVVIKRSSPPKPEIKYENGVLTINYPEETLANSLNNDIIKSLYKREYKIVKDGQEDSNVYKLYSGSITSINYDCNVTAVYTDPAGNISTATLRVFGSENNSGEGGSGGDDSIIRDGNTVTVEEGRPSNIYYIGTRRNANAGIDNGVFGFVH